ncbi:MAG: hypothetical protein ACI8UP_003601 [Porticoccaceae bacterium]|jgi:hypothetical protein
MKMTCLRKFIYRSNFRVGDKISSAQSWFDSVEQLFHINGLLLMSVGSLDEQLVSIANSIVKIVM